MDLSKYLGKLRDYHYLLFIILAAAFILRFAGLGYSHFYGDETKTFYLDKTVPATKFLLDQRKGPMQFMVVWTMEKITGGYNEFLTRLPFAWAGFLSVLVLYLIVDRLFNKKVALLASALFALNGFFIAFSRTIQYQSFLILFGLLAVYFALLYYDTKKETRNHYLVLAGVFLGLTYLSHYDAVFFDAVLAFIFIKKIIDEKMPAFKEIITYFLIPSTTLAALFYVPYVIHGFYFSNTVNYIGRRLIGAGFAQNVSWYTFWSYNPCIIWALLALFFVPFLLKRHDWRRNAVLFWFLVPFIAFQFVISDPGTHIIHYIIPFIIIVSLGIVDLYSILEKKFYQQILTAVLLVAFGGILFTDLYTYLPGVNNGFPWKDSRRGPVKISQINKDDFHLFLYGFPYNRGWDQIAAYANGEGELRKIYTNDNDTIAKYYLYGVSYTKPGVNYLPEHFIYIFDNQEMVEIPPEMLLELDDKVLEDVYEVEMEFFVNGEKSAILYKLRKL